MRPGTVEQRLHQVAVGGRGFTKIGKGGVGGLGVPALAHRANTADLLSLELGRDAQDLRALVLAVLIAIDPYDDALPPLDLLLQAKGGVGDLALWVVLLDCLDIPPSSSILAK